MRHLFLLILTVLFSVNNFAQDQNLESKKLFIEINYFHRTERCATCMSIQENIQKVLDRDFTDEVASGKLTFVLVNFEESEDDAKIEKYGVEGPTLIIIKYKKDKAKSKDLTKFALNNSLHNPKKFMDGLRDELNEMFR